MVTKVITGTLADTGMGKGEFLEKHGYQVLDSDISSISSGTTWDTGSDWVDVRGAGEAQIVCKFTGADSSSSGDVTFNFVAKADDGSTIPEPTTPSFSVVGSLDGTTEVVKDALVEWGSAYTYIKLLSVENGDSSYAVEDVNAFVTYKTRKMGVKL